MTLRRFSEATISAGYDASVLVALAESVLAYIEEVSSASAQGFAFEQSERAGETDRRRVEVLELILRGQADEVAVQQAAAAAGWSVPPTLVAVLLPPEEAAGTRLALGPRSIVAARETDAVALAPAPASGGTVGPSPRRSPGAARSSGRPGTGPGCRSRCGWR